MEADLHSDVACHTDRRPEEEISDHSYPIFFIYIIISKCFLKAFSHMAT